MADEELLDDIEDIEDIETVVSGNTSSNDTSKRPDSIFSMMGDLLSKIKWKVAVFIFLTFIFINTDLFIDQVLGRINNAVDHKMCTQKGTFIQGLIMVLAYVVVSLLVDAGIV